MPTTTSRVSGTATRGSRRRSLARAGRLNTNMRYLHESAIELAERLIATMPPEAGLDTVMFVNSGLRGERPRVAAGDDRHREPRRPVHGVRLPRDHRGDRGAVAGVVAGRPPARSRRDVGTPGPPARPPSRRGPLRRRRRPVGDAWLRPGRDDPRRRAHERRLSRPGSQPRRGVARPRRTQPVPCGSPTRSRAGTAAPATTCGRSSTSGSCPMS